MSVSEAPPWSRGWLYIAPNEKGTFVWIVATHSLALLAPILAPHPRPWVIFLVFFLAFLGGIGTSVGYHRVLTHKAARVHPVVEQVLIAFAALNGYGTPLSWSANHRQHHRGSDTPADMHSPLQGGMWWAQVRWIWQANQSDPARLCPDLVGKPQYEIWQRLQMPAALFTFFVWIPFGLDAFLWLAGVRIVYGLHMMATLNSICHTGNRPEARDHSRNVWWLTLPFIGMGENWHGNHHDDPRSARIGWRWWQIDVGYGLLRALAWVGLAHDVRGPRHERLARGEAALVDAEE